jgi:hypothetical protein
MAWKILIVVLSSILLSGCLSSTGPRDVEVVVREIPAEVPVPEMPRPVELLPVEWHVITEGNLEEKIAELRALQGGEAVVFAVTPQGYESSAFNLQELRRYIRQQHAVIVYYVDATSRREPPELVLETERDSAWWQFWR